VSKAGDVITNAHVVHECSAIGMKGRGDVKVRTARVRASDTTQDLALLTAETPPTVPPTVLVWRRDTRLGEPIAIYGYPYLGTLSSSTSGTFTRGDVTALAGLRNNSSHFQLSAPVQPGNSGGPVVDDRGYVVGIVVAKLNALGVARSQGDIPQNVNFAIKSAQAISFMEAQGVAVEIGGLAASPLSAPDVAERLQGASVLVVCAGSSSSAR
jgi:S1-C subfamily serine protease